MNIHTIDELRTVLLPKIEKVVEYVANKALEEIQEDVQWAIYDAPEGKKYKRTGDFKKAFKLDTMKELNEGYIKNMFYDWKSMAPPSSSENDGYTHGNNSRNIDRRKDLWWILNDIQDNAFNADLVHDKTKWPGAGGPSPKVNRLYLDIFNNELQSQMAIGRPDGWVRDGCKKFGIKIE